MKLPYNLTEKDLILDSASKGHTMDEEMAWLNDHISWSDELAMARIFRCTILLYDRTQAPLGECLATALIWECG